MPSHLFTASFPFILSNTFNTFSFQDVLIAQANNLNGYFLSRLSEFWALVVKGIGRRLVQPSPYCGSLRLFRSFPSTQLTHWLRKQTTSTVAFCLSLDFFFFFFKLLVTMGALGWWDLLRRNQRFTSSFPSFPCNWFNKFQGWTCSKTRASSHRAWLWLPLRLQLRSYLKFDIPTVNPLGFFGSFTTKTENHGNRN